MKSMMGCVMLLMVMGACKMGKFNEKWTTKQAPEVFKARFETSAGNFDIEAQRAWSPAGVDRLYQLITTDFYTDIAIFRVVPDFVVQFGINTDSALNAQWIAHPIADEIVIEKNTKGTISFARGGVETRSTQIFVNLKNNSPYLDEIEYSGVKGFPVIARVTSGMDVVEKFYQEYGNAPANQQDSIYSRGNAYIQRNFPKVDYIYKAYILKK